MTETCDFLVAGAGIVGLTTARALKERHPASSILVLEKEPAPGLHASGRNSGVLHSGIYYPPDTLKARFCREGARRMKAFARENGVALGEWGKTVLATSPEQVPALEKLLGNARAQGIRAEKVEGKALLELEPFAAPDAVGLHSPDTAVVDARGVMAALARTLQGAGVRIETGREVAGVDVGAKTAALSSGERVSFGFLYNCAGAHADKIARFCGFGGRHAVVPFKGIYRKLRPEKAGRVRGSLYPVPDPLLPFLGVHFTRGYDGTVTVGPTAIPVLGRENYGGLRGVRPGEAAPIAGRLLSLLWNNRQNMRNLAWTELRRATPGGFFREARRLMPALEPGDLTPSDKVGIRPQLINVEKGTLEMDYVVEGDHASLHVLNAVSPAFTSSFAFADHLADLLPGALKAP